MDQEKKDTKIITICLVDYRSCREAKRYGCSEEANLNGSLDINLEKCNEADKALWKKLQAGAYHIQRKYNVKKFNSSWLIKPTDNQKIKEICNQSAEKDKIKLIPIRTEISPFTLREKMQDALLHYGPLSLCVIAPHLVVQKAEGAAELVGAGIFTGFGLFLMGKYIYPQLDRYNSGAKRLCAWFGAKNYKPVDMGKEALVLYGRCCFINLFFYTIRSKAVRIITTICNELLCSVTFSTIDQFLYLLLSFDALVCLGVYGYEYGYREPFERSNKHETFYTLGDLIDHDGDTI